MVTEFQDIICLSIDAESETGAVLKDKYNVRGFPALLFLNSDGTPRDLHIEQAVNVINWDDHENPLVVPKVLVDTPEFKSTEVLRCEYFCLEKLTLSIALEVPMNGKTFHALFIAEGECTVAWDGGSETAKAGESLLIPAALPAYTLNGTATVLRTTMA